MRTHVSITIRQLEPRLKRQLKARAARHGRSMEDEAREILRTALAAYPKEETMAELIARIRSRFAKAGYADDLELPRREPPGREPPNFDDDVFDR
ncbi:MAG: hypothetical protein FWD17_15670 [Polyangiaceae bacterium]|nr:hypothetical protein [Polyangiaceae bacterium]